MVGKILIESKLVFQWRKIFPSLEMLPYCSIRNLCLGTTDRLSIETEQEYASCLVYNVHRKFRADFEWLEEKPRKPSSTENEDRQLWMQKTESAGYASKHIVQVLPTTGSACSLLLELFCEFFLS